MKRKWAGVIVIVMAVLMLVSTAVPAMAQSEQDVTTSSQPRYKVGLAIVAPRWAPIGQEVSMRVFERLNQNPVEGAGVWALTRNEAEALKQEMTSISETSDSANQEPDYESLVNVHGTLLGRTDGNGRLRYAFTEEGDYVLVTAKRGYFPGFAHIAIKALPDALAIEAPRWSPVGQEVTMTVFKRGTQDPINDAGVWALTRDEAEALKQEVTSIREASDNTAEVDYESLVSVHGFFLGTTHGNGELKYTFTEEEIYLLVAVKRGYIPGYRPIAIKTTPDALAIEAPRWSPVGQEVTMTVFKRGTQNPINDAGVWALTRDEAEALKQEVTSIREASDNTAEMDYESLVSVHGFFLGTTHGNGELKYTFTEEGGYLLVAVKKGYIPGYAPIAIKNVPEALAIEAPMWAPTGEQVTMTVFQKRTLEPVKDAGVWALTRDQAEVLKQELTSIREASENTAEVDYESLVSVHGFFLGTTHGNGELKYTFTEEGGYLLVAVKKGYIPGFTFISIRAPQNDEAPRTNAVPETTETLDSQESTD